MKHRRFSIVAISLASAISIPGARADDEPRVEIVTDGGGVDVHVHPSRITTIRFESPVMDVKRPNWPGLDFKRAPDAITLRPHLIAPRETIGSFNVDTRAGVVAINLIAVDDVVDADRVIHITPKRNWITLTAALDAAGRASCESNEAVFLRALHQALAGQEVTSAFLREVLSEYERVPIRQDVDRPSSEQGGVSVRAMTWFRSPRHLILGFEIDNSSDEPRVVERIQLLSEDRDHTGAMFVAAHSVERQHVALIPPTTTVSGLVFLRDVAAAGPRLALLADTNTSNDPAMQDGIPIIDLSPPKTPEQIRDEEARGRVSLQVKLLGGVIWLPNGLNNGDPLGATSITGLGARMTYGFNRYLSAEVEVSGAVSGTAMFGDVMFEGAQGDLRRGATVGRAQFGAVVSFGGETVVPNLRVGVGGQGLSNSSEFDSGTTMPGPNLGFEFSALWYAGIGLDVHLSDRLTASLAVSAENPVRGDVSSLEVGLHIGYSWPP